MNTPKPVVANPPAFPGTLPYTAHFQPINNKYNVYGDFATDWAHHVEFTVTSKQALGRALAGSGSQR